MPQRSSNYWVVTDPLRAHPFHGYSVASIAKKRFKEYTTSSALTIYFLTPFLQKTDAQVRELTNNKDVEPEMEDLKPIVAESGRFAAMNLAVVLAKITVQTTIASVLIERNTPLSNSIVYHWDMYPRLHEKYVGDILHACYLPRFLSKLLGPKTELADLSVHQAEVSTVSAFQDSLKRHLLTTVANMSVKSAVNVIVFITERKEKSSKKKRPVSDVVKAVIRDSLSEHLTLLGTALGAAGGHFVKGPAGEYWGEYAGSLVGALFAAKLILPRFV